MFPSITLTEHSHLPMRVYNNHIQEIRRLTRFTKVQLICFTSIVLHHFQNNWSCLVQRSNGCKFSLGCANGKANRPSKSFLQEINAFTPVGALLQLSSAVCCVYVLCLLAKHLFCSFKLLLPTNKLNAECAEVQWRIFNASFVSTCSCAGDINMVGAAITRSH